MSSGDISFEAHCPRCGAVELTGDQLWLVLADAPVGDHFAFRCPSCSDQVRRIADAQTVAVLSALVPVEELDVPAEALQQHEGAPFTIDDLIDLMHELERPGARPLAT
jgi:predicted RNA-binding Zn-ribbon protein involved in translation (DUF1610 family)